MANESGWQTYSEKKAIEYMASDTPRGNNKQTPTLEERIFKLKTWIETSFSRTWEGGVNVSECRKLAYKLLRELENK